MISLLIYSSTQSVNCMRAQASLVHAIFHHYFFNSIYIMLLASMCCMKFICNLMLPCKPSPCVPGRSGDASTDFVSSLLSDHSGRPTLYYVTRSTLARLRSLPTGCHLSLTLFRINRSRGIRREVR